MGVFLYTLSKRLACCFWNVCTCGDVCTFAKGCD